MFGGRGWAGGWVFLGVRGGGGVVWGGWRACVGVHWVGGWVGGGALSGGHFRGGRTVD